MRRTRRWKACVSVAAALAMAAGLGAGALAVADDDDEAAEEPWGAPDYAGGDEDGDDDDDDGDDDDDEMSGSPGETTVVNSYKTPCWISDQVGPSSYRELVVGNFYGALGQPAPGGRYPVAEAWFDDVGTVRCGDEDNAGTVPAGSSFFVRWASWYAVDRDTTETGFVNFTVQALECDSKDCTSCSALPGLSFSADFTTGYIPQMLDWIEADRWDRGLAATGHVLTAPAAGVTKSYLYGMTTIVTNTVTFTSASASGCVAYTGI